MAAVASIITIALFLVLLTSGSLAMAGESSTQHLADRLGVGRLLFRRVGIVQVAVAVGLMVGLAGRGTTSLAIVNDAAAAAAIVLAAAAILLERRHGAAWRTVTPVALVGLAAVAELVFRLLS
ncbi:MAG: hypothetical protein ACP5OV_06205 [Acidimicrobiales bacterium]